MTLREKVPEMIQRKYSVSHSGKFKSRPKIRPSLSGDLFRPSVDGQTQNDFDSKSECESYPRQQSCKPNQDSIDNGTGKKYGEIRPKAGSTSEAGHRDAPGVMQLPDERR
ncbi:uncharacterized protein LOC129763303 [Toxorhynchites rutilus septentrionalis]|uniref:uncharacterized protein LOC129763303 n=1 Tax=Toxorhynchites rutilus septentrionalis TaxID=329112 RepID=UPI00247A9717|nr:uncharacterized protein LOC129763303 [Toxorhynchites rutilus septentrionalis]